MEIEDGPSVQIYSQSLSTTYSVSVCARACVYVLVRVSACVCQSEIEKDRAEQRPAVDLLERKLLTI